MGKEAVVKIKKGKLSRRVRVNKILKDAERTEKLYEGKVISVTQDEFNMLNKNNWIEEIVKEEVK